MLLERFVPWWSMVNHSWVIDGYLLNLFSFLFGAVILWRYYKNYSSKFYVILQQVILNPSWVSLIRYFLTSPSFLGLILERSAIFFHNLLINHWSQILFPSPSGSVGFGEDKHEIPKRKRKSKTLTACLNFPEPFQRDLPMSPENGSAGSSRKERTCDPQPQLLF